MCIANLIFKHASLAWMLYIFCLCVPKCESLFIGLVWKEQIILINIESSFWQSEDILLFHSEVFCPFVLFSSSESIVYVMSQFSVLYIHRILPHDFFSLFLCILEVFLMLVLHRFLLSSSMLSVLFFISSTYIFIFCCLSLCMFLSCFIKTTSFTLPSIQKIFLKFSFEACSTLLLKMYLTSDSPASYFLSLVSVIYLQVLY